MKIFLLTAIILIAIATPSNSFAWGKRGHDMVAQVAYNYLDTSTRIILMEYLDGMTIQEAANWMDEVKGDKKYDYLRKLHYINAERGQKITATNEENIIGMLTKTIEELKNYKTLTKEEVKIKLCIVFHLVGDLHQPLHVGYGEDKGGNNYQINFYGKGTNLHSFYDSGIIEYKNITLPQCLNAKNFTKEELSEIEQIDVVAWANQSRSFLPIIYKTNSNKVDDLYVDKNYPIIQEQILKAGIRLSSVLREIFS